MPNLKKPQPEQPDLAPADADKKKERPSVELEEDSIEVTVPKLNVERIKMKFGGVRIAIHDSDKTS